MSAPRNVNYGELTLIIIGTVVASGEKGTTAGQLVQRLRDSGIELTLHQAVVHLEGLAQADRIERIGPGVYKGV